VNYHVIRPHSITDSTVLTVGQYQHSYLRYVRWFLNAEPGFDPRAVYVKPKTNKAALGDVHLAVRRIFLVDIIPPMLHDHPFIHHNAK